MDYSLLFKIPIILGIVLVYKYRKLGIALMITPILTLVLCVYYTWILHTAFDITYIRATTNEPIQYFATFCKVYGEMPEVKNGIVNENIMVLGWYSCGDFVNYRLSL